MATPVKRSAPGTAQFAAGEAVLAQWPAAGRDSPWHAAKVEAANEDGTFALSYPELARVNPAVPEGSIRSGSQGAAAPPPAHAGRIQCYSIAKDMLEQRPEARPALVELCQALQRSSDVRGELSGLLRTLDAEDPAATATFEVPPPPSVGAPRPSARAEPASEPLGRTISSVSSSTPPGGSRGQETPDEVFLGDARSLSVPGPNLKAAERLRQQLATTVESAKEGGEGAAEGAAEPAPVPAGAAAAPATLLASTFFMPAFEGADEAFKEFITSRLVYKYGQRDLQDRMIINWAVQRARLGEEHRLVPMWTLSDGNCLLHASLLGIWGLHDKKQIAGLSSLRAAMCTLLGTSVAAPMRERFLAENGRQNTEAGFAWDKDQEEAEWQRVLVEARTQNTFLRPVHVLAMACVLKRPIIMYSDTVTRDAFNVPIAPVPFFGVYLPFLCPPESCSKQPLVLVFDAAHFMPLVASADAEGGEVHVPLCDKEYAPLPVRFRLSDDEVAGEKRVALLSSYLELKTVAAGSHDWEKEMECAVLKREGTNELVAEMLDQFVAAAEHQFKVVGPDEDQSAGGAAGLAKTNSTSDRMLAEQLGREAAGQTELSDAEMAQRLQNEAFGGSAAAPAATAQSDADAQLAQQLAQELNPNAAGGAGAAGSGAAAGPAAATDLVCRFKVVAEHVAQAGSVVTITSAEYGQVRCRLPPIIMPGQELQVRLGQDTSGDADGAPLAESVPTGGDAAASAPASAPAPAPEAGGAAFEPTDEQMAQFMSITGAVRSAARTHLVRTNGDVTAAVNSFFTQNQTGGG